MWNQPQGKSDVESRVPLLYPTMLDNSEMRWLFIRKVYSIITIQLLATIAAVGTVVFTVRPISTFLATTTAGLAVFIVLIIVPLITLFPLIYYHQRHPVNYILLGIFTLSMSFVGLSCAFTTGKVILEAIILTIVVVIAPTLYTFWAARRGQDFGFLGPFLFGALLVLFVFELIQVFFPLGKLSMMIHECLGAILFCGYIVYHTDNMIKRLSNDQYIWASVTLYLDIINLFVSLTTILQAADF